MFFFTFYKIPHSHGNTKRVPSHLQAEPARLSQTQCGRAAKEDNIQILQTKERAKMTGNTKETNLYKHSPVDD